MFRSYYSVFKVRLGDVPPNPVSRNLDFHHMVGQNGLEPSTSRLSVVCSSQLSYWPMWWRLRESNPWPPACKAGALPAELNPHIRNWVPFSGPSKSNNIYLNFNLSPVPMTDHLRCSVIAWLLRKEVIQPQVLLRLPCYDFTPITSFTSVSYTHLTLPTKRIV